MTNIEQRITDIISSVPGAEGVASVAAASIVHKLGLKMSPSGYYWAYKVELTDEERDLAGFTHHRRSK